MAAGSRRLRAASVLQRHDRIDGRAYATEIDWIGTSLGGLIGMVLAALPGSPIRRLVINDIGPYLPWAGLLRLGANLSDVPKSFETIEQAEDYYRRVLAPFGQLEEAHWRHLTTR